MNRKQKGELVARIRDEQSRLNAVRRTILEGDTEASYRLLVTASDGLGKVRIKLFNQLHSSIKATVKKP